MRSKRQHPLHRFGPAAVAPADLVAGASSPSSAADSAATGKTALTTITITRPAAAVFDAPHTGSLAQVPREGNLTEANNYLLKDLSSVRCPGRQLRRPAACVDHADDPARMKTLRRPR